ncbi:MAG: ABC transporter substrate-binding protein [Lachnospiraceae bacterium]|nr:ABC transporter substrate-binding protein [Lachnospiraceae bacterium]
MKKKLVVALLSAAMASSMLMGCGGDSTEEPNITEDNTEDTDQDTTGDEENTDDVEAGDDTTASASGGKVYYLNFKPEVGSDWEALAASYTEQTGVEVKVVTAASGTYEQTLKSEVAKTDAPTLFQINGPMGYQSWKDYCMDLSGTEFYNWLNDKSLAVTEGDGVYGIPYVVEGYGIIYNDKIMRDYFALEDKAVEISSATEIKNFDTLKAVVEDMQAKKDQLGIEGVFASTSFKAGEDWRWQTHLANLPFYYEMKDKGLSDSPEIELTYGDNFKNIFDLYINNSCTDKTALGTKSVSDSMAEFALGKAAMVQNGNWSYGGEGGISQTVGNVVAAEDVKFLPIYTGVSGEESQGLCVGTENYMCINSQASEADQQATIEFVEWVFSSDEGKAFATEKLGIVPFSTFTDADKPSDPLGREVSNFLGDSNLTSVPWSFVYFPSQTFKDELGYALLDYCNGQAEWSAVTEQFIDGWATEKEAVAE